MAVVTETSHPFRLAYWIKARVVVISNGVSRQTSGPYGHGLLFSGSNCLLRASAASFASEGR